MAKKYDGEPRWDGIDPAIRTAHERRLTELEGRWADPAIRAATDEAVATARSAEPPFMKDGVELVPPIPGQFNPHDPITRQQRAGINARIAQTRIHARKVKVKDLLGKIPKTQEQKDMAKLRDARNKVRKLGDTVRTNMFNDWLDRCVVKVEDRRQWTRARELYESYVRHARQYGPSLRDGETATVTDRMVAREEMSTETAWGKMMGSLFPNKERRSRPNGWHYPVRLKRDA